MYNKKKKKYQKILIIIFLSFVFIIGYLANVVYVNRQTTIFEKAIKDSVLVIQKVLTYPIDFIIEKVEISKEKQIMYIEYERLKKQFSDYEDIKMQNQELDYQIVELNNLLDINKNIYDFDIINATVVARDLSYFNDELVIDKGLTDGIIVGLPVIVKEGLIGKIVDVTNYNSVVKLITSLTSDSISVKVNNNGEYVFGILSKYTSDNIFIIEGISGNIEILTGSLVTTTGMTNNYPSGIVLGKIEGSEMDNFGLSKILKMKSDVSFDKINYVSILKRKDLE